MTKEQLEKANKIKTKMDIIDDILKNSEEQKGVGLFIAYTVDTEEIIATLIEAIVEMRTKYLNEFNKL